MKRIGKFMMIAAMAMASYSASAELEPQWSKGTMMVNAAIGVQPFGGTVSLDYVLVDEWWKGHFTVGGEFDFSVPYKHETAIGITPRATYGLNITPEFEVHVTAETGFGFRTWQYWNGERCKGHRHIHSLGWLCRLPLLLYRQSGCIGRDWR